MKSKLLFAKYTLSISALATIIFIGCGKDDKKKNDRDYDSDYASSEYDDRLNNRSAQLNSDPRYQDGIVIQQQVGEGDVDQQQMGGNGNFGSGGMVQKMEDWGPGPVYTPINRPHRDEPVAHKPVIRPSEPSCGRAFYNYRTSGFNLASSPTGGKSLYDQNAGSIQVATDEGMVTYQLPYRSTSNHPVTIRQIGQMDYTKKLGDKNVPVVYDGQVPVGYEVVLPPRHAVLSLNHVSVTLDLSKYATDKFPETEMLCFLDQRVCSGKTIQSTNNWEGNFNPAFWGRTITRKNWAGTNNTHFIDQLLRFRDANQPRGVDYMAVDNLTLELSRLLQGGKVNALDYLYSTTQGRNLLIGQLPRGTVPLVVAENTFVGMDSSLQLELEIDTCKLSAAQINALDKVVQESRR